MALVLQKLVLPLMLEMHAGQGLLKGDAVVFHNLAINIALQIQAMGWIDGFFYLVSQGPANIALLAALYTMLGPDPVWFIPINAAAHTTGALLVYRLGPLIAEGNVGKLGGLLSAICFLVFPSALLWYGQNHKDAFMIVGFFLVLEAWIRVCDDRARESLRNVLQILLVGIVGLALMWSVRAYTIAIVLCCYCCSFLITWLWSHWRVNVIRLTFIALAFMCVLAVGVGTKVTELVEYATSQSEQDDILKWEKSALLPANLDYILQKAAGLRHHFIQFSRELGAGSLIDADRDPANARDVLAYLPRALVIGLFSPFPSTWGERTSLPHLIVAMEACLWYLALLGSGLAVIRYRSFKMLSGICFCITFITIFSFIVPNIGTLYRLRFAPWFFFMLIGIIGWVSLFASRLRPSSPLQQSVASEAAPLEQLYGTLFPHSRTGRVGAGAIVTLITLASFLGFLVRDLLLVVDVGLGVSLDSFFAAIMIAMFFVNCFALPLGDAFVTTFVAKQGSDLERTQLMRGVLGLGVLVLTAATCFVYAGASWLAALIFDQANPASQAQTTQMLRLLAPMVGLSAWTVIGNAVLNSLGKPHVAAFGQLLVPITTLAAMVMASNGNMVLASIKGIFLGILVNIGIVFWQLRSFGIILMPSRSLWVQTFEVRHLYWPLVAASIFPAAQALINYAFAASVTVGMAASWALSSKMVVLFSNMAAVLASAVVLPKMAQVLRHEGASHSTKHDVTLMLSSALWVGGVLMVGGFIFAGPLVDIALRTHLSGTQLSELVVIFSVGLMQIPLVILGSLINKVAVAMGRTSWVMYAAIFACSINVVSNLVLVPSLGVLGVAIGALISTLASVAVVLVCLQRLIGLPSLAVSFLFVCWLAFVALSLSWQSHNTIVLVGAIVTLGAFARREIRLLRRSPTA